MALSASLLLAAATPVSGADIEVTAAADAAHGVFEPDGQIEFLLTIAANCADGATIQSLSLSVSDTFEAVRVSGTGWTGQLSLTLPPGQLREPLRPAYCADGERASDIWTNAATAIVTLTCASPAGPLRSTRATPLNVEVTCRSDPPEVEPPPQDL